MPCGCSQLELDYTPHPIYLCANLVECRRRAASKPFVGGKRYELPRDELLEMVRAFPASVEFDALAHAWREFYWGDVFRSLLRLQREGDVEARDDDRWAPADGRVPT